MKTHRIVLLLLAAVLQFGLVEATRKIPRSSKPHPHGNQKHQQKHTQYRPVDPSVVGDYESRQVTANAGVGDFVYQGIGGLMRQVNREYGLRQTESFYWGPSGNPNANLTAYTNGKNVRVLSLERFHNVLQQAKCTKTAVEFTFLKEVNFDRVQEEWKWINDAEDNYLVLVTENARCNVDDGDPSIRQPWHITKAVFNDDSNQVILSAKPKTWEDAFDHWHLKVSSKGIRPPGAHPSRSLEKRIGYNGTQSLSLEANFGSDPIMLTSDDDDESSASISCNPCYTTGSLDFAIDVTYWFPATLSGSITVTPDNIGAMFMTNIEASEDLSSPHRADYELFSLYPDGFHIDGIITVGPHFSVGLFAELSEITAKMDVFSSGISMAIPADAVAILDFDDSSKNTFSNWSPIIEPQLPNNLFTAEVSVSASAGVETKIEFDLEVFEWGLSAGLVLDAPGLGIALTAETADGGVCENPDADFGIDFDVSLGAELDFFAGFGGADDMPNRQSIWGISTDLFTTCMVVASGAPPAPSQAPSAPPSVAPGSVSAPSYPSGSAAPSGSYAAPASSSRPASSSGQPSSSRPASSSNRPASSQPAVPSYPAASTSYPAVASSSPAPQSSYVQPASSYVAAPPSSYAAPQSSSAPAAVSSIVVVYVSSAAAAPSASASGW